MMNNEKILDNPTVGQLMEALQKYPSDSPVIISDADTGWDIAIIHINDYSDGKITLSGDYTEMVR